MDSFSGPDSPRHTFDNPKPETGLAEWTSKIKALQRQVDEDEEAEQRKLEEEIAAARRARLRRSRGYGGQNDSVERTDFKEQDILAPQTFESSKSLSDRQLGQEEAMRKLTGSAPDPPVFVKPVIKPSMRTTSAQAEPISLASFIGGRATGPRLNRLTPQQNAHDPTQFIDPIPKAPHPVFGRGGVAMPGMSPGKPSSIKTTLEDPEAVERYRPTFVAKRNSTPVAQKYVETLEQQRQPNSAERPSPMNDTRPGSPFKRGTSPSKAEIRERTISSPNLSIHRRQARSTTLPVDNSVGPIPVARSYSRSPIPTASSISPATVPASPRPSSSQKPSGSTLSLARPIFPEPRPVSSVPQIPASIIPSPAFQKPTSAKDPTPSISRLQGRGFVQNMVRASSQLQSTVSPMQEKPRSDPMRKTTVLDRWRPNETSNTSSSPSSNPAQSIPKRKSMPSMQFQPHTKAPDSHTPFTAPKRSEMVTSLQPSMNNNVKSMLSLRKVHSVDDSLARTETNLGSATTMMVYKPESIKEEFEFDAVDELGVKQDISPVFTKQVRFHDRSDSPEPTMKPLSHPTKERARKPRRSKSSSLPIKDNVKGHPPLNKQIVPTLTPSTSTPSQVTLSSPHVDVSAKLPSNITQIAEKWEKSGPISVKVVSPNSLPSPNIQRFSLPLKHALPGMTSPQKQPLQLQPHSKLGHANQLGPSGSSDPYEGEQAKLSKVSPVPSSPRHARIPSTGNRATVMDIASSFSQYDGAPMPQAIPRANSLPNDNETSNPALVDKRRFTYERLSSPTMPVLKEETSPLTSPAGTLSRKSTKASDKPEILPALSNRQVPSGNAFPDERLKKSKTVHFDHVDTPIPKVDVDALISFRNKSPTQSHDAQTIQVEVLSIVGSTANVLSQNTDIFYDTEVLAIVHRSKSKSSGLASATVWGWKGKKSQFGLKEELKLQELAKRYGTEPCVVRQFSEPNHLVHVLGGQLTIRQGSRSHWTTENTAMYLVRSSGGVIYIDEQDLGIKNLCSAFSYCMSILSTIYVWHGCGSTALERQAALWYAQSLTQSSSVVELSEGENDNDEMFWMILGEDSFAKADYWKWRKSSALTDPAIWRVDASLGNDSIIPTSFISSEQSPESSVYIIDCVWELFVMVGFNARGQRQNIRLALDVSMAISKRAASARPYTPTVHVLVLPSRLPLDLRMNIRDMNELSLNNGNIPDHMNLLSSSEALDHLQKRSWERYVLNDSTMLPLGLDASHVSTA